MKKWYEVLYEKNPINRAVNTVLFYMFLIIIFLTLIIMYSLTLTLAIVTRLT